VLLDEHLQQQINNNLGGILSDKSLQKCLSVIEIVQPAPATLLWQASDTKPGIYIILSGKVRLLDQFENLITSLGEGESYGELSLFPQESFHSYIVRASNDVKLCYLKGDLLTDLIQEHPQIIDYLKARVELWDFVLLCRQNSQFPHQPSQVSGMLKAWSLFERHHLHPEDKIPIIKDEELWLVYQGNIYNNQGKNLQSGQFYTVAKSENWQVKPGTIIYILKKQDWSTALQYCQELEQWLGDELSPIKHSISANKKKNIYQQKLVKSKQSYPVKIIPVTPSNSQVPKQPKKIHSYFPSPQQKIIHWWARFSKTYPFYAQQSASDCGAACLVMIGKYWGKYLSVNRVRDMTNISRNGATLSAIANAAENFGFATRPVKATFDKLAEQSLPAIAHWQGNHFIVIYEINKKHIIVGDPAIGQRKLTRKEFIAGWTEYALLIQPTSVIEKTENQTVGLWKFWQLITPHYKVLLEIFIASVVMQLFGLVTPIFTQLLLDRVLVQRSLATLNAIGLGMIIFGLFSITMNGVRSYLLAHTANRISISLIVGFIKHTFRLPLSYFESRYVGDIISRIQENEKIQNFLTSEVLSIILDILTLVIYLTLMFSYSWKMALFVLVTVPPFFILALASTGILRRISREIFNAGAKENSYMIESLTGIRTVRSLAVEQKVRWHWEELLNDLVRKDFNAQVIGIRLSMISGVINTFTSTALMWFGAWQVIQGELSVGQLVAFNMLVGNVLGPFQKLSGLWNQFQEILISVERLNDVLEAEPEEDLEHKPRKILGKLRGHIRFENVTFRYHPESKNNVLENINLEIQPEQTVALVGRSGSGKTTLSKLILGLYPPTEGKIIIDGHDLNGLELRSLRSQVGVVDQDTFLFGDTIRENIAIAHPEATLDDIIQAAKLAGADEFIQQQPLGYETKIGEGGGMLSGGQRQRIAIARALLGNPRLLLFDEATSHLDPESERIIQNNLKTILKGRTSVIIAHRLSTVRNADLILVLDQGILVESGTHDQLIAQQGHYYYLNQQQLGFTEQLSVNS
jgi:ATP-binding cassette subfamily B protein